MGRRVRVLLLPIFGLDKDRRAQAPAQSAEKSRDGRSAPRSLVLVLILSIRLLMALALVLGLLIRILEFL